MLVERTSWLVIIPSAKTPSQVFVVTASNVKRKPDTPEEIRTKIG
jgi:hypothetical protein